MLIDSTHLASPTSTCMSACRNMHSGVRQVSNVRTNTLPHLDVALSERQTPAYPNANAGRMSAPCCIAIRTKPAVMPNCTSATAHMAAMGQGLEADSSTARTGAPPQVHDLLVVLHVQALLQHACLGVRRCCKPAAGCNMLSYTSFACHFCKESG